MKTLFVPLMIILAAQTLHAAQPKCESREERQEIGSTQGSADIISNFLKRSGSLAVECDEAVQEGFEQLESQAAPEDLCGSGCGAATAQVYLKTVPEEFLQSYPDQATCDQMLIQTKKQPLIYKAKTPDVSGLQKWINRFSQGKNAAGIQLYKQCPGACSPQYEYLLQKLGTGFEVDAHVICGPARNKWDNRYSISYGLRWICTAIDQ